MSKKNYIIPIFVPELACPFQCLYCNQEKISGQHGQVNDQEIVDIVEKHLNTIPENASVELAFFGGNFTGIPFETQKHFLQIVFPWIQNSRIKSIRCSTRPDYINEKVIHLFKKYGGKTIELGAQSLDDAILEKTKRGHNAMQVKNAANMIKDAGLDLGLQMMLGLPGDTKEKAIHTAKKIIAFGANNTRIYPALVIKNTGLHSWYQKGQYTPLSLEEAVDWSADILPLFEDAGIIVQRVGLHPSEGLIKGEDLIAGPFHPSFKELVLTEIWKRQFAQIKQSTESIQISVNPKEYNYAIGYQSTNKLMLQKTFKKVSFIKDPALKGRAFICR